MMSSLVFTPCAQGAMFMAVLSCSLMLRPITIEIDMGSSYFIVAVSLSIRSVGYVVVSVETRQSGAKL